MDGFLFYWTIWLFIIANYFFNEDKKNRDKTLFLLFLLVISSNVVIPIISFSLRATWLIFALVAFRYIAMQNTGAKIYLFFISTFISGIYLFIYYFVFFEPVWLYLSPLVTISSLGAFICIVLLKKQKHRLAAIGSGFVQGDLVQWFILLENNHLSSKWYIVGDYPFLDIVSISMLIVFIWNGLEMAVHWIKNTGLSKYYAGHSAKRKLNA